MKKSKYDKAIASIDAKNSEDTRIDYFQDQEYTMERKFRKVFLHYWLLKKLELKPSALLQILISIMLSIISPEKK